LTGPPATKPWVVTNGQAGTIRRIVFRQGPSTRLRGTVAGVIGWTIALAQSPRRSRRQSRTKTTRSMAVRSAVTSRF